MNKDYISTQIQSSLVTATFSPMQFADEVLFKTFGPMKKL